MGVTGNGRTSVIGVGQWLVSSMSIFRCHIVDRCDIHVEDGKVGLSPIHLHELAQQSENGATYLEVKQM